MAIIRGTAGADTIYGTARADHIYGLNGRDIIFGGAGNDTLDGGGQADRLFGGAGFDLATYATNTTPVWADLRLGTVRFPGQPWAAERLVAIEAVDGGRAGDTLIGNGAANLLRGNAGADHLIGNMGADTLLGGGGRDRLEGGAGADVLNGGMGDDTMLGGTGHDRFDVLNYRVTADGVEHLDPGADVYSGGAGRDTVVVSSPIIDNPDDPTLPFLGYTAAHINLNLGTLRLNSDANRSTLISIENVETDSGNDAVNGSAAANYISVGDGENVVYAGNGDDTIVGGSFTYDQAGGETLNGGAGDDVIYGNGSRFVDFHLESTVGRDYLAGGAGDDSIYGGEAYQTMSGGTGDDLFSFYADNVYDENYGYVSPDSEIVDFESGDRIQLDSPYLNGNHFEFVGEANPEDLDPYEVGYYHDGDNIIVVAHTQPYNGTDEYLEITLTGFQGSLTAANFDLG